MQHIGDIAERIVAQVRQDKWRGMDAKADNIICFTRAPEGAFKRAGLGTPRRSALTSLGPNDHRKNRGSLITSALNVAGAC